MIPVYLEEVKKLLIHLFLIRFEALPPVAMDKMQHWEDFLNSHARFKSTSSKMKDFMGKLEKIEEDNYPSKLVSVDDVYRGRQDSTFSHGMSSILAGSLIVKASQPSMWTSLTAFPKNLTIRQAKGPWLGSNTFIDGELAMSESIMYTQVSIYVGSILETGNLREFWAMIDGCELSLDLKSIQKAPWPIGTYNLGMAITCQGQISTSSLDKIPIDLLIGGCNLSGVIFPRVQVIKLQNVVWGYYTHLNMHGSDGRD